MILYLTKDTIKEYDIKMPEEMSSSITKAVISTCLEKETDDQLVEWGGKIIDFDDSKCILITNFASRLTLVLVDVKVEDFSEIGNMITSYMFKLYDGNVRMNKMLNLYFTEHPKLCFLTLTDGSVIARLNHTQLDFFIYGYRLADYISDGIMHTYELNNDINREWVFSEKKDGKSINFHSAEKFESLMEERYGHRI